MEPLSANPDDLNNFVSAQDGAAAGLDESIQRLTNSFIQFRNSPGGQAGASGDGIFTSAIGNLQRELRSISLLAKTVELALRNADRTTNGVVSLTRSSADMALAAAARALGVDLDAVMTQDRPMTVALPEVGTIPPTSGWVNDPVMTSTGSFALIEHPFPVGFRARVLSEPLTYSSLVQTEDDSRTLPFGAGWFWWTSVLLVVTEERSELTTEQGQIISFAPQKKAEGGADSWTSIRPDIDADLTLGEEITIVWGRRSHRPFETWTFNSNGRLASITHKATGRTQFRWDANRLLSVEHESHLTMDVIWNGSQVAELRLSDGQSIRFSFESGLLIRIDRDGTAVRYGHDSRSRISKITDADDVVLIENMYDDAGRVLEQRTNHGGTTFYRYVPGYRTIILDEAAQEISIWRHDDKGRAIAATVRGEIVFAREFDESGRVAYLTDEKGVEHERRVETTPVGIRETVVSSTGAVESVEYDELDRLVTLTRGVELRISYGDESPLPIRMEGPDGFYLELDWSDFGLVRLTDADGVGRSYERDSLGRVLAETDGLGNRFVFDYSPTGQLSAVRKPDGSTSSIAPSSDKQTLQIIDPLGASGELRFSPAGRLLATTDPLGFTTTYTYTDGMLDRVTLPDGRTTKISHGNDGRPRSVQFDDGSSISIGVNDFGEIIDVEFSDASGWSMERDIAGRLVSLSQEGVSTLSVEYRTNGGAIREEDSLIEWTNDAFGNLIETIRDGSPILQLTRDDWSDPIEQRSDERAEIVTHTPGRRVQSVQTGQERRYTYDAAGRVSSIDVDGKMWLLDHDSLGRLTEITSPEGRTRTYTYDAAGRLSEYTLGSSRWTISRDALGRALSLVDPTGVVRRFAYDSSGQTIEASVGSLSPLRFEYDARGRISAFTDDLGSQRFVWDGRGRVVESTDAAGSVSRFSWNGMDQLTGVEVNGETHPLAETSEPTESLEFVEIVESIPVQRERDGDGLLRSIEIGSARRDFVFDELGLLRSVFETDSAGQRETHIERDRAGRITTVLENSVRTDFAYDDSGQLVEVRQQDSVETLSYDRLGRLVSRDLNGTRIDFLYDDAHQLREIRSEDRSELVNYDASGIRTAELDCDSTRVPLVMGDPLAVAGVNGSEVFWTPLFGGWAGRPEEDKSTAWHPFQGIAHGDHVHLGYRVLDLRSLQFFSRDPYGPVMIQPGVISPYNYAFNDPITFLDPYGLSPVSREEFQRKQDEASSIQWDHVAIVVATVVVACVAPYAVAGLGTALVAAGASGAVATVAASAIVGAAGGAFVNAMGQWGEMAYKEHAFDFGTLGKATLFGAVGGAVTGGIGLRVSPGASFLTKMASNVGGESAVATAGELYDVVPLPLPGSDHSFDVQEIVISGGLSALGEGASEGIGKAFHRGPIKVSNSEYIHSPSSNSYGWVSDRNMFDYTFQAKAAGFNELPKRYTHSPWLQRTTKAIYTALSEQLS